MPPYSNAYFIYWEAFMRLLSFLTTSMTLSKIRRLVRKEEWMIAELLETSSQLVKYTLTDRLKSNNLSLLPENSKA